MPERERGGAGERDSCVVDRGGVADEAAFRKAARISRCITMWKYLPLVTNKLRDLWREWKRISDGYNGYNMHHNDNGDEYKLYFISSNTFEHE